MSEDMTAMVALRARMLASYLAATDLGEDVVTGDKSETLTKQPIRLINREDYPSRQAWRAARRKAQP